MVKPDTIRKKYIAMELRGQLSLGRFDFTNPFEAYVPSPEKAELTRIKFNKDV
jgi:hypothetical protein